MQKPFHLHFNNGSTSKPNKGPQTTAKVLYQEGQEREKKVAPIYSADSLTRLKQTGAVPVGSISVTRPTLRQLGAATSAEANEAAGAVPQNNAPSPGPPPPPPLGVMSSRRSLAKRAFSSPRW